MKVRQENDQCFFLISLKNDQLYHKRLKNPKIFDEWRFNYPCLLVSSLGYVLKVLKIEVTFVILIDQG